MIRNVRDTRRGNNPPPAAATHHTRFRHSRTATKHAGASPPGRARASPVAAGGVPTPTAKVCDALDDHPAEDSSVAGPRPTMAGTPPPGGPDMPAIVLG